MKNISLLSSLCGVAIFLASGCLGVAEAKRSLLSPRQNFSNKTQVVQWQSSSQTVSEGAGTVQVTAVLNAPSTASISVPYAVSGSASSGSDHKAVNGTLTIPAGSMTTSVSIAIANDTLVEPSETIVLTMGIPTGAVLGTVTSHTITITDNDVAPSPTPSPTVSPKPSPTPSPTVSPKPSPTPSPTLSPKPSPTPSPTPTATDTPSPTPTTGCTAAPAGTYYVDSTIGLDTNNGTNTCTPWKTLAKVNATTLRAGDKVLFRKGSTYYGSLNANFSGVSGSPITYGAYGTGANPVITGFTTVSGWTNLGGNIWESTSAVSSLSTVNMVTVNNVNTPMGRFPNSGYLTITSHSGSTSLTSSSLTGSWTGAEIVVKLNSWKINKSKVTSQSGTTLNYSPAMEYPAADKFGFFIQNSPSTLDIQNEWYFDPTTKKLRIYSSTQPASVKVASVDTLVTVQGSYVTFDGLDITGANKYGVYNANAAISNLVIQNSSVLFSGMVGIQTRSTSPKVDNCLISDSGSEGIFYTNSNSGAIITNNTVRNTGVFAGMGNNSGAFTAIRLSAPENTLIQYNRIINTGFNGIAWYNGSGTVVKNNFIDTFCSVLDDGGGIYSYYSQLGSVIEGNIVMNAVGAGAGTDYPQGGGAGIYNDDESKNFKVTNNTVANCNSHGIFSKSSYADISSNTVYNSKTYQMLVYLPQAGRISTNTTTNNIFFCKTASQMAAEYDFPTSSASDVGILSGNYYARPINDTSTIRVWNTDASARNYTLAEWQAYSGRDAGSRKSPKVIADVSDLQFEYNDTKSSKTIPLSVPMIDVKGNRYSGSVTLQPYTSIILIKD